MGVEAERDHKQHFNLLLCNFALGGLLTCIERPKALKSSCGVKSLVKSATVDKVHMKYKINFLKSRSNLTVDQDKFRFVDDSLELIFDRKWTIR